MTEITTQETERGHLTAYLGIEAGKRATRDFARYMSSSTDTKASSGGSTGGSSTLDKIGAIASMVGALTGVAGLGSSSGVTSKNGSIELELINLSSYAVVPWKIIFEPKEANCSLGKAARPLSSSDRVPLTITEWYQGFKDGNKATLSFLIGLKESITIDAFLVFSATGDDDPFWQFEKFTVDGKDIDTRISEDSPPQGGSIDELQAVTFLAKEEEYPSFSLYSHTIHRKYGITYLAFCDADD